MTVNRFQGHGVIIDVFGILCAQLTRNLFAIAKFLLSLVNSASDLQVHTIRLCFVVFFVTSSLAVIHMQHQHQAYRLRITISAYPTCIRRPRSGGGVPSEYCYAVWHGKTRMAWLPGGVKKFEDIFIRFDMIHERYRLTDGQIDRQTPHDDIGCAYASHRAAKSRDFRAISRFFQK